MSGDTLDCPNLPAGVETKSTAQDPEVLAQPLPQRILWPQLSSATVEKLLFGFFGFCFSEK